MLGGGTVKARSKVLRSEAGRSWRRWSLKFFENLGSELMFFSFILFGRFVIDFSFFDFFNVGAIHSLLFTKPIFGLELVDIKLGKLFVVLGKRRGVKSNGVLRRGHSDQGCDMWC